MLQTASYPTAVVLGGGFFMDGTLTTLSRQRLDAAIALFRAEKIATITVLGERKSTYLSNAIEFEKTGAEKRADYLAQSGIPTDKIHQIPFGRDTIGEALAVKKHGEFSKFLLITSDLHMPRAHWIFQTILGDSVKIEDYPVPCDGLLLMEEEQDYLAATRNYFATRPHILENTDNWHTLHSELYATFKTIHDKHHPKGKESQAYCAVRDE